MLWESRMGKQKRRGFKQMRHLAQRISQMRAISLLLFIASLVVSFAARADYLQVNRPANVYAEPNRSSDVVFKADAESKLLLTDSETENGYYHVQYPATGKTGWIYRPLVRRYKADIPQSNT